MRGEGWWIAGGTVIAVVAALTFFETYGKTRLFKAGDQTARPNATLVADGRP